MYARLSSAVVELFDDGVTLSQRALHRLNVFLGSGLFLGAVLCQPLVGLRHLPDDEQTLSRKVSSTAKSISKTMNRKLIHIKSITVW